MTKEQKEGKKLWAREYRNGFGRANLTVGAYKNSDKKRGLHFDLDAVWFRKNIESKPCHYCGEIGRNGCDRIDNSLGHTKDNVLPSCWTCNAIRGNRFTCQEMELIGNIVRKIKAKRQRLF